MFNIQININEGNMLKLCPDVCLQGFGRKCGLRVAGSFLRVAGSFLRVVFCG